MNPADNYELGRLRNDFDRLRQDVEKFGLRLEDFEAWVSKPEPDVVPGKSGTSKQPAPIEAASEPVCPVVPPPLPVQPPEPEVKPAPVLVEYVLLQEPEELAAQSGLPQTSMSPVGQASFTKEPKDESSSFEMKLGTYWFVRLGVVMLLTGLAFFGYYAYQHYILHLGPWGKLAFMYLLGGGMLAGGAWCQRDEGNAKLSNFGQVVLAGGLATIYFTTYAAHHIEYLRVIKSAFVDGILLMGWAVVVFWLADRKKSEVMALFAIGLSFYTSIVTHVGMFTLVSNLILTLAAVGFFLRNRWVALSLAGMVGTYLGYAFWRFYYNGWSFIHLEPQTVWYGLGFLSCYWVIFCSAAFVSRAEQLIQTGRFSFLTLNNFAFFGLATLNFWTEHHDRFWAFCIIFGAVQIGLSALAFRYLEKETEVHGGLLTQGLLLITLGLVVKFSGMSLALMLAAESVALLITGYRLNLLILRIGAYVTAALSVGFCLPHITPFHLPDLVKAVSVGAAMLYCGCVARKQIADEESSEADGRLFFWSAAVWLITLVTTWQNMDALHRPIGFALLALLLAHTYGLLRIKELVVMGQLYLAFGQLLWLESYLSQKSLPAWLLASLTACTVWMGHWWQHQTRLKVRIETSNIFQGLLALMLVLMAAVWLQSEYGLVLRIPWTAALAVVVTVYALVTRWWTLAVVAQALVWLLAGEFLFALAAKDVSSILNLLPIGIMLGFGAGANYLVEARISNENRAAQQGTQVLSYIYYTMSALMSLLWVHQYLGPEKWFWVQVLLGACLFAVGMFRKERALIYVSLIYTAFGLFDFWRPGGTPVMYPLNLFAIAMLFVQQLTLRRVAVEDKEASIVENFYILAGGSSLWFFLYRWLSLHAVGFYITAGWAALAFAFFVVGLILQHRTYRWFGLSVLICALLRVMLLDVWRLETIYRVLSFMALGIVLVVLGFIYNRYQEEFKKWL